MQIIIRAIGKEKDAVTLNLIQEYIKRIGWSVKIEEYGLNNGDVLIDNLAKNSYIYVLDENGMQPSSKIFSEHLLQNIENGFNTIYFLIGSANGHTNKVLTAANYKLSLSKMTFPHKMVRYILLEQIYRAYTINKGHPYHK